MQRAMTFLYSTLVVLFGYRTEAKWHRIPMFVYRYILICFGYKGYVDFVNIFLRAKFILAAFFFEFSIHYSERGRLPSFFKALRETSAMGTIFP